MLAIHLFREIISFTKQVTPVSIAISNSKSTYVAIPFILRFRLMVPPSIKMTVFFFRAFLIRLPNFSFWSGSRNYLIRLTYHPSYNFFYVIIELEKPYLFFFSKIKNKKVRDSFISSKSMYVDVRTTENQEAKFSEGIYYEKPNTINPIFIGNWIEPFSVIIYIYIYIGFY